MGRRPGALRRRIRRALGPGLRRLGARLDRLAPPPLDPRQAELLDALAGVVGAAPFTAAEVLELAHTPTAERRLQAALQAAGAADAQRLGLTLATLARRTAGRRPRIERHRTEGGSRVWCVEGTEGD